jgi:signal transduction histidine kinase
VGADTFEEDSGAGLGLAIARGMVELHGGCIWAASPLPLEQRAHLLPLVADPAAPFRGIALCFTLPLST